MRNIVIASTILLFSTSVSAATTCSRQDLTGRWISYTVFNSRAARCVIDVPATGSVIASTSNCFQPGQGSGAMTASFTLYNSCRVTGNMHVGSYSRQFELHLSSDKITFAGMNWNPSAVTQAAVFHGVKR